jgi:CubicO group peptidase (beta-lactamase class C family)
MLLRPRLLALATSVLLLAACGSDEDPPGSAPASSGAGAAGGAAAAGGSGGAGAGGAGGAGGGIDPRFQAFADAVEAERAALGAPGVAVAVIEDGEVTFAAGFGSKDPNGDDPVLPTTLFRIGSVQKMLTSTAVLQQVGLGNVELDAPITDVLPEFDFTFDATWAPSITTRNLLTHTSGIADYLEIDVSSAQQQDTALETFLLGQFGSIGYLMAPAGSFWNYSNPGFYLAGYVAEKASGELYRDYMRAHVFEPLGMTRTFHLADEVLADGDYALGKTASPGLPDVIQPDTYDNAWARPAGYGSSSVLDLARFVRFLDKGDDAVLSAELRQAMQTTQVSTEEIFDYVGYGYGLQTSSALILSATDVRPLQVVEHGGDIPGFAADVFWAPAMDLGFVFLSNADGAHFTDSILTGLQTLGTLPEPIEPPDFLPDAATLEACAGTYLDDFNVGEIVVTNSAGALTVSMPALDAASIPYQPLLQPYAGRTFILGVQGTFLLLTFIDGEAGTPHWLRTRAFVGARVDGAGPGSMPDPPRAPRPLDVATFEQRLAEVRREPALPTSHRRLRR